MGVSGQLHVLPALPRKKEAVLITGEKVWWTPDVVWGLFCFKIRFNITAHNYFYFIK
jgi:hypothetical protein